MGAAIGYFTVGMRLPLLYNNHTDIHILYFVESKAMDKKLILNTKLYIPPIRQNQIARKALNKKLDQGYKTGHKVILVSAAAGYGKTTLISGWVNRLDCSCAWLSLDERDNEPARFIYYLITSIRRSNELFGKSIEDLISAPKLPAAEIMGAYLIKELEQLESTLVLVLDDYHSITNGYIHELMQKLLDSEGLSMVSAIVTRQDPPFTLSRWRARDRVTELRTGELKFETREIGEFFDKNFDIQFDSELLRVVEERTEGWAASLQLTGLYLKNMEEMQARSFIEQFRANNRYIIEYLVEEVLERQGEETRAFLKSTCMLKRFRAELCDAVRGERESRSIIEKLDKENLFIVPLDSTRTWYRYHQLFSEVLGMWSDEAQKAEISKKAGRWCKENGFIEEAMEYALEAGDGALAESLVKQEAVTLFQRGAVKTLLLWLNAIRNIKPERDIALDAYRALCLYITGEEYEAYKVLKELEARPEAEKDNVTLGILQSLAAMFHISTDKSKAVELAQEAVRNLKNENEFLYFNALIFYGQVRVSMGHTAEAVSIFSEVYEGIKGKGYSAVELPFLVNLADNLNNMGKKRAAFALCEEALAAYTDLKGNHMPIAKTIYLPLGILIYYSNRLKEARKYLEDSLDYYREIDFLQVIWWRGWYYVLVLYAMGEKDLAMETLYKFKGQAMGANLQQVADFFDTLEIELQLREKNLPKVRAWLSGLENPEKVTNYPMAGAYLTYIRALILQGDLPEAEARLLEKEKQLREHGKHGELITVLLLLGLVKKRSGMEAQALAYVKEALTMAAPEGYVRSFLDEDPELLELAYKVRRLAPEFVDQLMKSQGQYTARSVEALSGRELEILKLVAAGRSNDEIAVSLYITTGTVKWHIKNIYSKLDVKKRVQAVEKARQLNIIS